MLDYLKRPKTIYQGYLDFLTVFAGFGVVEFIAWVVG